MEPRCRLSRIEASPYGLDNVSAEPAYCVRPEALDDPNHLLQTMVSSILWASEPEFLRTRISDPRVYAAV